MVTETCAFRTPPVLCVFTGHTARDCDQAEEQLYRCVCCLYSQNISLSVCNYSLTQGRHSRKETVLFMLTEHPVF